MLKVQSVTIRVLYDDDEIADSTVMVILDKSTDDMIDVDGLVGYDKSFKDAEEGVREEWQDWLYDDCE